MAAEEHPLRLRTDGSISPSSPTSPRQDISTYRLRDVQPENLKSRPVICDDYLSKDNMVRREFSFLQVRGSI